MRSTQQFSITVPNEMGKMIKDKVASGEYASESEVVRDGLRALQARDRAVEHWLRQQVIPAYDEAKSDPTSLMTSAEARARLAEVHTGAAQGDA